MNAARRSLRPAFQKSLVAAKHYFRYIRPGAVRVNAAITGTSNLLATAFVHETNRTLTLVLLNTATSSFPAGIQVPTSPFAVTSFRAFTSQNGDLWRGATVSVSNGVASVAVPAQSLFENSISSLWRAPGWCLVSTLQRVPLASHPEGWTPNGSFQTGSYGIVTLYAVAPPRLHASQGANQLQLSWAQAGLGFQIQASDRLLSPITWTGLTNAPEISNDIASLVLPIGNGGRYYRLALP